MKYIENNLIVLFGISKVPIMMQNYILFLLTSYNLKL